MNIKTMSAIAALLTSVVFSAAWAVGPEIRNPHDILKGLVGEQSAETVLIGGPQMAVYEQILHILRVDPRKLTSSQLEVLVDYLNRQIEFRQPGPRKAVYTRPAKQMVERISNLPVTGVESGAVADSGISSPTVSFTPQQLREPQIERRPVMVEGVPVRNAGVTRHHAIADTRPHVTEAPIERRPVTDDDDDLDTVPVRGPRSDYVPTDTRHQYSEVSRPKKVRFNSARNTEHALHDDD